MGNFSFSGENAIFHSFIAGFIVLTVIVFYFIYFVFANHRRIRSVQRRLLMQDITHVENERTRIATDLHDSIGAQLLLLQYMTDPLKGADEKEGEVIRKANELINNLMKQVGETVKKLSVINIERKGLEGALNDFLQSVQMASSVKCRFYYDVVSETDPQLSKHLFRVVQEISQNMMKHSAAHHFDVYLQQHKSALRLMTVDDGVGFQYPLVNQQHTGLGLLSISSRINMLGGNLKLITAPGKGTQYLCSIPLNSAHA